MAEIKTKETYLERPIEIKWQRFNALLIMRATCRHLDSP